MKWGWVLPLVELVADAAKRRRERKRREFGFCAGCNDTMSVPLPGQPWLCPRCLRHQRTGDDTV